MLDPSDGVSAPRLLGRADRFLDSIPPKGIVALSTCGVGLLFVLDLQSGYELAFSVFYLLPIGIGAWTRDRGWRCSCVA